MDGWRRLRFDSGGGSGAVEVDLYSLRASSTLGSGKYQKVWDSNLSERVIIDIVIII